MSTRSTISIQHAENDIESVYCHFDGYIQHNGQILYAMYDTADKVQELINHGDISILDMNIGVKVDFDDHKDDTRYRNAQCLFYARDRDEELNITKSSNVKDIPTMGYDYLFDERDSTWYLLGGDTNERTPLIDAIKRDYRRNRDNELPYLFDGDAMCYMGIDNSPVPLKDLCTVEQLEKWEKLKAEVLEEPSLMFEHYAVKDSTLSMLVAQSELCYEQLDRFWRDDPVEFAKALSDLGISPDEFAKVHDVNDNFMSTITNEFFENMSCEYFDVRFTAVNPSNGKLTNMDISLNVDLGNYHAENIPILAAEKKEYALEANRFLAANNEKHKTVRAFCKAIRDEKKTTDKANVERE